MTEDEEGVMFFTKIKETARSFGWYKLGEISHMKIDELKAGPELDVLVAEMVMGWTWIDWPLHGNPIGKTLIPPKYPIIDFPYYLPPGKFSSYIGPYFSSDISDAWQVVEKLRKNFHIQLVYYPMSDNWRCILTNTSNAVAEGDRNGDTAPLAICKAALRAIEKK